MEDLSLKEIVGYYPNKLQVLIKRKIVELIGLHGRSSISTQPQVHGFRYCSYKDFKPLLYPLSMLTQEIEHNGEKVFFVKKYTEDIQKELIACQTDNTFYEMLPFFVIEEMLEHHFDIFGLIERGLAIDKSKI